MKKFILLLIASLTVLNSKAQWSQIAFMAITPDTASNVNMYAGFGGNLYSATNKGIFVSTTNGNSWTSLTYNVPVTQSLTMVSVWEESVTTIYAGSDKRLYKSTNSGSTWTWIPLSIDSISITDIQRSNSNLVLCYNKNFAKGGAFYSSNNGLTWNASNGIPATNPMQDLHVEGDTVYVAGKGGIYRSVDKGVNFSFLGNGTGTGLRTINRHQGNLFAGDGGGTGMYVSTNNGVTWSPAAASVFAGFCQVFSTTQAPGMILTAVDGGSVCNNASSNPVKASTDGGVTWTTYTTGLSMPGSYTKVGTNSNQTSFFTSVNKKIYRTNGPLGIKEVSANNDALVYFDGQQDLNIKIPNTTNINVKVYSINGSILHEGDYSDSNIRITGLQDVKPGVLFVMMTDGKNVVTKKVLKPE
jgi:photosystem II stability/assembly factor-like uncharacterized protein